MAKSKKPEPAIEIKHITKQFVLPKYQNDSLKQMIVHGFKRNEKTIRTVLNDVSFTINKGDFFGIVGRNGSGKSTLLKLICGIYTPTSGEIVAHGGITPFIELGVGFNPELSGRDNVYLNGALLGFDRKEMRKMYDEIVAFAELEEFMDLKLKNFSSGMQVRLAFSIAIKAKGRILILDEVLAVGDEAFQKKCYQYFAELKREKRTVVLVTHDMDSVQRFCNRAVMIEKGKIVKQGNPSRVAQSYRELFISHKDKGRVESGGIIANANVDVTVRFADKNGRWNFKINVVPKVLIQDGVLAMIIFKEDGEQVWNWASDYTGKSLPSDILRDKLELEISLENIFPVGRFYVNLFIRARDRSKDYAVFNNVVKFEKRASARVHKYDGGWQPNMNIAVRKK